MHTNTPKVIKGNAQEASLYRQGRAVSPGVAQRDARDALAGLARVTAPEVAAVARKVRRVAPFRRAADPAAFLASRGVGDPVLAPTELGVLEPAALIARGVRALRTRDSEDFQLAAGGMGLNRSHGNGAGWAAVACGRVVGALGLGCDGVADRLPPRREVGNHRGEDLRLLLRQVSALAEVRLEIICTDRLRVITVHDHDDEETGAVDVQSIGPEEQSAAKQERVPLTIFHRSRC